MTDVFISYKREQRPRIEQICQLLSSLELDVWFDARLTAGEAFTDEINKIVKASKAVLVCWSPEAAESSFIRAEALAGLNAGKLISCMIAPVDLPVPFNQTHAADLRHWAGDASAPEWQAVLSRLEALLGRRGVAEFARIEAILERDYDHDAYRSLRTWLTNHTQDPLFRRAQELAARNQALHASYERATRDLEAKENERRRREAEARAAQDAERRRLAADAAAARAAPQRRSQTRRETFARSTASLLLVAVAALVGVWFYMRAGDHVGRDGDEIPALLPTPLQIAELDPRIGESVNVWFASNGSTAIGYADTRMVIWNALSGETTSDVVPYRGTVSGDGDYQLRYLPAGAYEVWSTQRQTLLRVVPNIDINGCIGRGSTNFVPGTRSVTVLGSRWAYSSGELCAPDGDTNRPYRLMVFDLNDQRVVSYAPPLAQPPSMQFFSENGAVGAMVFEDGAVVFWRLQDGAELARFPANTVNPYPNPFVIRADGAEAFSRMGDQFVMLDISTGRARYVVRDLGDSRTEAFGYVGDDARAVIRPVLRRNEFDVYSLSQNRRLARINAGGRVNAQIRGLISVALSARGRLLTYGDARPVRVWNSENGRQVAALPITANEVSTSLSADGSMMIINETGSPLHRLRVFRIP